MNRKKTVLLVLAALAGIALLLFIGFTPLTGETGPLYPDWLPADRTYPKATVVSMTCRVSQGQPVQAEVRFN